MSSEPLSDAQQAWVLQLETGELEKSCLEKNQAYGHGRGTASTSFEYAVSLETYFQHA